MAVGIFVDNGISNNAIQGNLIGTDATGTQLARQRAGRGGIFGASNVIGGTDVMARNVISDNGGNGILMGTDNALVHDNLVQGNFIGTDITGTNLLGNTRRWRVRHRFDQQHHRRFGDRGRDASG